MNPCLYIGNRERKIGIRYHDLYTTVVPSFCCIPTPNTNHSEQCVHWSMQHYKESNVYDVKL